MEKSQTPMAVQRAGLGLLVGLTVVLYVFMAVKGGLPGMISDAFVYVLQTGYFGHAGTNFPQVVYQYHFPPGYALWLAAFGASPDHLSAAFAGNTVAWILAFATLGLYTRRLGLGVAASCLVAITFALNLQVIGFSRNLLSEGLFMALFFGALALMANGEPSLRRLRATGGVIGVAILVRTAGVALLPGLLLLFVRRRRWDPLSLLLALIPGTAWTLLHRIARTSEGYLGYLLNDEWSVSDIGINLLRGYVPAWVEYWSLGTELKLLGILLGVTVLIGAALALAIRIRRLSPDAFCVLAYVAIIAVWPFPSHATRFLMPVVPVLLALALWIVWSRRPLGERTRQLVPAALALMLLAQLPGVVQTVSRLRIALDEPLRPFQATEKFIRLKTDSDAIGYAHFMQRIASVAQTAPEYLESSDCVLSPTAELFVFYSGRQALTLTTAPGWEELEPLLQRCPFVFVVNTTTDVPHPPLYPVSLKPELFRPIIGTQNESGVLYAGLAEYRGDEYEAEATPRDADSGGP